ncbi:MAG TPA: cytochrome c maturation protein CcmE [Gammaproteobacteria bacterium]|nr:cytochrome c maturation protein CcmE [Gammaproteobacteria bacterium]|tara:strand:+ start:2045 stop:2506 length:462 start_codon:yes stop_codon:yes gene_type:complete
MRPHRRKRLGIILFIATGLSVAIGLTLYALSQNIDLFYTPTQVAQGEVAAGQRIRIGGMVREGSVVSADDSLAVEFVATDYVHDVPIFHEGILPDLFREGQGIVVEGSLDTAGVFQASRVLAKHDENYMSPEVKAALDAAGASSESHQMQPGT